jgi:branched-chain amino acid transport system permease protein
MAVVLVWRPWGLLGQPQAPVRQGGMAEAPLRAAGAAARAGWAGLLVALALLPFVGGGVSGPWPYATVLMTDVLVAALFAASLHFLIGPAGMHSFGHAAYFGLGAYGAALLAGAAGLPMGAALALAPLVAAAGALLYGWFCVRLSGVYLAMLTLAFAQITWAIAFQWDAVTGGSNGLTGLWPSAWLGESGYYLLVLALVALALALLRRVLHAPFGMALRAARDSAARAGAIGIDVRRLQWAGFVAAGLFAGLAGALYVFSKGGISPEGLSVGQSVDGLVMVLLGGVQTLAGPVAGAAAFTWLHDTVARSTDYWRALLGGTMLLLVLLFPQGIAGFMQQAWQQLQRRGRGA